MIPFVGTDLPSPDMVCPGKSLHSIIMDVMSIYFRRSNLHSGTAAITAITCCVLLFLLTVGNVSAQERSGISEKDLARMHEPENLDVFHQWIRWSNGGSVLMNHLIRQAFDLYRIRDKEIAQLRTREDWEKRQEIVRQKLKDILGSFPERTPLQPQITEVIKQEGYQIEKFVYQSHPGFYVTGCLYVPDMRKKGKVPAVLNLIGHEQEGFRAELDQVMAVNLVKKGMVVLTIDPLGQGEHIQYFDPRINFSSVGYSVVEHCYFGNQSFLSGINSARYFIWDAIRGIDYLVSRKEVDPERIGVTGFSGGGTITAYVGALDERVKVAIPSSWSTANRRQLETKGAQDAEATLIHSISKGITFEDLMAVRAPRPAMMTFVSRDEYLTLQGAREAYDELQKVYKAFSRDDDLVFVEDDSRHWLTPRIREAIYGFFMKHFDMDGDPAEVHAEILSQEQLRVTPTGQIANSFGGKMVYDIHETATQPLIAALERSRQDIAAHLQKVTASARSLSGYVEPNEMVQPFINGQYQRDGYTVAKYAIGGEGDYAIPFLLFVPDGASDGKHPAVIYLHPEGKIADARAGGEIERLVRKGYIVAAADVLGVGETENTVAKGLAAGYTAVLIGRSIVGIQAGDISRILNYLKGRSDVDQNRVGAIGIGEMCLPLMHAAAFNPGITNVIFKGGLMSYRSIATNRKFMMGLTKRENGGTHHPYDIDFSWGIANVLRAYDLPDLLGCIAPRRLVLAGILDHMLVPADQQQISIEMKFPLEVYSDKGASSNIKVVPSNDIVPVVDWAFD